ncbi:hypothetical protein [Corynebacterium riegelii]|uniref:DUF5642 domain-containing protein n=1 Tax=Corynebacterium riegelii TaxID=156976 RepID=A0A0K1RD53_9CORY|nr:hypothetical protein [Corynebacterium riegelii]AKV59360.1 hypothetical protein AK829_09670 [Corynebacterium riegelii]
MSTIRQCKKLGSVLVISSLLLAAGCSTSGETGGQEAAAPAASAVPYPQLLEGITYKGQPVVVASPEELEETIQTFGEWGPGGFEIQLDPPECGPLYGGDGLKYNFEKLSPETFTVATAETDGFSVRVYNKDAYLNPEAKKLPQDDPKLAKTCQDYSITTEYGTIQSHIEALPFKGNTDRGYAHIQTSQSDDMEYEMFYTAAWKNDAYVTLSHTAVDPESIDAGFETLNMILDRL